MKHLLVTGGGGFVGGNFVRLVLRERPSLKVTVFDSLTGRKNAPVLDEPAKRYPERFELIRGHVTSKADLEALFSTRTFDTIVHFAAKNPSGDDIVDPGAFVEVNIIGTAMLLETVRAAWKEGEGTFLHLSSYEVYGSDESRVFTEGSPLNPSTPYAASKASADQLTLAYHRTYNMRTLVTRTTNIYGPYQSRDKLIPAIVDRVKRRKTIPVFGNGLNRRDWIHVDDHNRGVLLTLEKGKAGGVYLLGARCERTNLELVHRVARLAAAGLGRSMEEAEGLIGFVRDREAHDASRSMDPSATEEALGFKAAIPFDEGLKATVEWLLKNSPYPEPIRE